MKTFELGKTYKHSSGKIMRICGIIDSKIYGKCLLGEEEKGGFIPIGNGKDHFTNWKEINSKSNQ